MEDWSKINIQEMYPNECEKYDVVVHMGVWSLYNAEPKEGDFIDKRMIKEVTNDGTAYFISFVK